MSRQIQIRRGTKSENDNFTGAVGEITMDTDTKTLRVHDGQTVGGIELARADKIIEVAPPEYELPANYDFVIESGETSSGWYRKYKSGWVEQGGNISVNTGSATTVNLPVPMANTNYYLMTALTAPVAGTWSGRVVLGYKNSTTQISIYNSGGGGINPNVWEVKGKSA